MGVEGDSLVAPSSYPGGSDTVSGQAGSIRMEQTVGHVAGVGGPHLHSDQSGQCQFSEQGRHPGGRFSSEDPSWQKEGPKTAWLWPGSLLG